MRKTLVFFITGGIFYLFGWLMTQWSLHIHPWLTSASVQDNWKWYNYFSSHDALAVLYIRHGVGFCVALGLLSVLIGLLCALVISDKD